MKWEILTPNEHGDWLNQRDDIFETFIPIAPEKKFDLKTNAIFLANIVGVATGRDAWVLNFSKQCLANNLQLMIEFYNNQSKLYADGKLINPALNIEDFIDTNPEKISWTRALRKDVSRNTLHSFKNNGLIKCMYRPFTKEWIYYDKNFIESPGLWSQIFPTPEHKNLVICCMNVGSSKEFSTVISDCISEYQLIFANQCFPLYYYEEQEKQHATLFDSAIDKKEFIRRDAVSDFILGRCRKAYGDRVVKEDIFYYVYGVLHSAEYRERFASDLKKMLPRLPLVDDARDFWAFSKAGRALAALHLNYENVAAASGVIVNIAPGIAVNYRVEKMLSNTTSKY